MEPAVFLSYRFSKDFDQLDLTRKSCKLTMVGYVYMMQIGNEPIYKVVKTLNVKSIQVDKLVYFTICDDHSKAKYSVIKALKTNFNQRKDIGISFFEGNIDQMIKCIHEALYRLSSTVTSKLTVTPIDDIPVDVIMEAALLGDAGRESEDEHDIREQYDLIIKTRQNIWFGPYEMEPEVDYKTLKIPEVDGNRSNRKKLGYTRK